MSFKEGLESIGEGIADMTKLNVRTYTGTITGAITGNSAQEVMDNAFQSGGLEVVGITTMMLDGDVDQFVSNSPTITEKLHNAHFKAVNAGQQSRAASLELFSSAVKKAIENIQS